MAAYSERHYGERGRTAAASAGYRRALGWNGQCLGRVQHFRAGCSRSRAARAAERLCSFCRLWLRADLSARLVEDSLPSHGRAQLDGHRDRAHWVRRCRSARRSRPDARVAAADQIPALPFPDQGPQRDRHAESLSSPYHRERVRSLRKQTHGDWRHRSMQAYRSRLRHLGNCRVEPGS